MKVFGRTARFVGMVVGVLPLLINVSSFRAAIESEATNALGRQVTVGNVSLSLLTGSVEAHNIAIGDDPEFSKSSFVTVRSLTVGIELMPLIFSKQLKVTDITLDAPQVTLLKTADGKWNFSSVGWPPTQSAPHSAKSGESVFANFSAARLNLNHGKLLVGKTSSSTKPVVYDDVNISVRNFSFTSEFPIQLTARLPGSGDVNISGKAGPMDAENAAKTPLAMAIKISNMMIEALGIIDPRTGIAGLANFEGTLTSDGSQARAMGLFTGSKLKFSAKGTPAPQTVTIKPTVDVNFERQSGTITEGDVAIGTAQAHLTGTFQTQGGEEVVNLKLSAPSMPVDELEPMLPSMGVVLPSGSQPKGGTFSADLAIAGPLDKLVITGPVRLADTRLSNFDLGSQLGSFVCFRWENSLQSPRFNPERQSECAGHTRGYEGR